MDKQDFDYFCVKSRGRKVRNVKGFVSFSGRTVRPSHTSERFLDVRKYTDNSKNYSRKMVCCYEGYRLCGRVIAHKQKMHSLSLKVPEYDISEN
jgi:hypothetical protein